MTAIAPKGICTVLMGREMMLEFSSSIANMINELFDNKYDKPFTESMINTIAQQGGRVIGVFSINGADESLVAMTLVIPVQTLSRRTLICEELFVYPEYRRKGIAQAIEEKTIEFAEAVDCDSIEILVNADNYPVQMLHINNGYEFRDKRSMVKILKQWEVKP